MASLLFVKLTRKVQHNRFKSFKIVHDENSTLKNCINIVLSVCTINELNISPFWSVCRYLLKIITVKVNNGKIRFYMEDKYGLLNKRAYDELRSLAARDAFNLITEWFFALSDSKF